MILLKKASLAKRKEIYKWLYHSDFSPFLNKLQNLEDNPVPNYLEFKKDYENFFFDDSELLKGRGYMIILKNESPSKKMGAKTPGQEIGFISYTSFHLNPGIAELDIWLKSLKYVGKGYGTTALTILTKKLFHMGFHTLIIRPSKKNQRAVHSYKKAGFVESLLDPPQYYKKEFIGKYAAGDYGEGQDLFLVLKKEF